ncbi:MAG: DMT family transporter [Proteobacteria bacterium]|nr:DMT family transporter [Pseudomonadota bacterium]
MRFNRKDGYYAAIAGVVLTVLFWSGNAFVGRSVYMDISPLALNFWRWTIAVCLFAPFTWRGLIQHKSIILQYRWYLLFQSFLSITVFNCLNYLALHTTTVVNLNLVNATTPVMIFALSQVLLGVIPKRVQWFGLGLALAGFVIVVTGGEPARLLSFDVNRGDLWMLFAVSLWSLYSVLLKRSECNLPMVTFLLVQMLMGVILLVPFYLIDLQLNGGFLLTQKNTLALIYIGIFPSIIAVYFWNNAVKKLGPNVTSMFMYLAPIFAAILGTVFLGESLGWHHLVGELLILTGFYCTVFYPLKERQP